MTENLAEIVTKDQVEKALEYIITNKIELIPSTKFDLIYKKRNFPPKEVVRWAAKLGGIKNIADYRLAGGDSTNIPIKRLGFDVLSNNFKTVKMISVSKIPELKTRWAEFQNDPFYLERKQQLLFVPWAKSVIEETLKEKLTNERISVFLQIFDVRLKNIEVIKRYLPENVRNSSKRKELVESFEKNNETGFTTSPIRTIRNKYRLSPKELTALEVLLKSAVRTKSIEEAKKIVEVFENVHVKLITHKFYSPWLYYLNQSIFPIKNKSNNNFIEWCGQNTDSYLTAIQLFHEVADILGEKELGLIDAFAHKFIPGNKLEPLKKEIMNMSLNTILYGPPGTGKTYNTINKAVAIANPEFDQATCSRDELQKEYNRLYKDGQIEFITFHQGMSYEDFIEGIKPMEPREGDEFLKYEIKEGIFKRLCEKAAKIPEAKPEKFSISNDSFEKAGFYKISLGDTSNPDDDQIYEWCIANGYIALGWGDAIDFNGKTENDIQQMVPEQLERFAAQSVNYFIHYLKPGDYVVVTFGNLQFRAIGKVTGNYEFKNVDGLSVHQFRKVDWLVKNVELPYEEVYNKQFSQQSIYRLNKREIKKDFFVRSSGNKSDDNKIKNYVLIIDEINRGNVSQIFGELITLIEVNKRAGNEEALSVQLPYSKKQFSVPNNLYIIGTMNTADRSVEALDTALRRRFVFEEMMPKPELLEPKEMICRFWNQPEYSEMEWDEEPYQSKAQGLYDLLGIGYDTDQRILDNDLDEDRGWRISDFDLIDDSEFTGIKLNDLLEKINNRIERLLSRDNCIGHSYFLKVYSLKDLRDCFKNEIIPLLQEYFYGDYGKMSLVLGKGFVDVDPDKSSDNQNFFAKADYDSVDSYLEKKVWQIKQIETEDEFRKAIDLLLN